MENVRYYFAHGGKSGDGLQPSKPGLAYQVGSAHLHVDWHDPAFPESAEAPKTYPMTWPHVYQQNGPSITKPKGHANVLTIDIWSTYYTVPWPATS
jgi:hypothetical protein